MSSIESWRVTLLLLINLLNPLITLLTPLLYHHQTNGQKPSLGRPPLKTNYGVLFGTTPCPTKLSWVSATAVVSPEKPEIKSIQERSSLTAHPLTVMMLSSWTPLHHILMENLLGQVRNGRPKIEESTTREQKFYRTWAYPYWHRPQHPVEGCWCYTNHGV